MRLLFAIITFFVIIFFYQESNSCTNILVSKGASIDASTMVSYNADAGGFMEPLAFIPRANHKVGDSLSVYDWDTEKFLGKIKQVQTSYQVIGNMNEYQLAIGETTFTGREELQDTNGIIDYGSLIRITLQRAKTAREAIKIIDDLLTEYGYYSTGESFSIADPNEVWLMDLIGKGPNEKGAVWVAMKVPDGYIAAHANQSRIRTFPLNDPENCLYSKDVISFAEKKGYYNKKKDGEFSFVNAYNPLDPGSLLFCEGRVWSIFKNSAPSQHFSEDYWRAVEGAEPYPLFIKPDKKLSVADVIDLMRDHFDGTEYDLTKGLAAEPFGNPSRWKPLQFKLKGDSTAYGWERPISTQQTAFAFVSQSRSELPNEIGGVFWYGVDDNYTNVYVPLYCGITAPPPSSQGYSISEFSLNSAFWVFNLVANLAYNKYSLVYQDIKPIQEKLEKKFHNSQASIEKAALDLYKSNKDLAISYLTDYSVSQFEATVNEWRKLWEHLVVKYNDGYINDVNKDHGRSPKSSYYSDEFYKRVVKERPGYYDVKWKKKK
ncbi:MAG TPA: C69 family dipeptidase [Candidatus Kapabacteria bacterium]|nr:C69 family dipeptidase [Candidatus Kapabacteria bacterium]